jgi:UDP-2,3-diacylglucosamine hydrolase
MHHKIQDGAIFIADAHYSKNRLELKKLLTQIKLGELQITQLFLMGDVFDFLCDELDYFQKINHDIIELINEISFDIKVVYLEGNHDFNISKTFKKVEVIARENQPVVFEADDKKIALSHGDIFTPKGYDIYCAIIRNRTLAKVVNMIDINNWFSKWLENWLGNKHKDYKFENFEEFASKRIEAYKDVKCDYIIEGHFHQGKSDGKYINIPALLENQYLVYRDGKFSNDRL